MSWILIIGYILTISVYAFTFGHYVAHVFNLVSWFPRVLAFSIIAALPLVNLRGVNNSSKVERITVWGKLFVLLGLSIFGIVQCSPEQLTVGIAVIFIYILVALNATMLVGAETLIQKKKVALSIAGEQAFGITGLILVIIAVAFSTGSAINATLFSTGRLMETVAKKKDLPIFFCKRKRK